MEYCKKNLYRLDSVRHFGHWHYTYLYYSQVVYREGGKAKKRGAVYVYVTHRPWEKRINEVSLVAGYSYKKDSTVHARIGGQKFTLFTDGDTAWNRSPKEDKSLVAAMRRGNSMVVTGVPKKGKQTTDTYSLKGFSKAYDAIGKACGLTS